MHADYGRDRYHETRKNGASFRAHIANELKPNVVILDVGSGNEPVIPLGQRPAGCHYAGLDISEHELLRAPEGAYDEIVVLDATEHDPRLEERFDLIVSLTVFEHIRPLGTAVENLRTYLRPGGVLVASFPGGRTYFAVLNRIVPTPAKHWLLKNFHNDDDPADIFPAYYDQCHYRALEKMFRPWGETSIESFHTGVGYLKSFPPLRWGYLKWEDQAAARGWDDLASNYVVRAVR